MVRQTITISGQVFSSRAALERQTKELRNRQKIGVPLSEEDFRFVVAVFATLYPGWSEKAPAPVVSATVVTHEGSRVFRMRLASGETIEPSLRKAFEPALASPSKKAIAALRAAAQEDCCIPYRNAYFAREEVDGMAPCELTGTWCTPADTDVDHIAPDTFAAILGDFVALEGIRLEDVPLHPREDGRGSTLAPSPLRDRWLTYHRSRAKLRVIARETHVELTRAENLARNRPPEGAP